VVGHAAIISAGEWITATGDWVNDRTHGQQFKSPIPAHLNPNVFRLDALAGIDVPAPVGGEPCYPTFRKSSSVKTI
jgi:hypothetical protein